MPLSEGAAGYVKKAQIAAAALMGGVLMFTAVVVVLVSTEALALEPNPAFAVLVYVAVGYLAVSLLMAPMIQARLSQPAPDMEEDAVAQKWLSGIIVGLAVREGAGLLGLVASLLVGSMAWALAFGLVTVAGMAMAWPRDGELEEGIRQTRRGG